MKRAHTAAIIAAIVSTVCFFVFIVIRIQKPSRVDFSTNHDNWVKEYERYVKYSSDRWESGAMAITNGEWVPFVTSDKAIVYYKQKDQKYVEEEDNSLHFAPVQINALKEKIVEFFKTYSDGSYDSFINFHQHLPYNIDVNDFLDDESFTNWVIKYKKPFVTQEEKLKTLWEFPVYEHTIFSWFINTIHEDQRSGKRVNLNLQSSYITNLYTQFDNEFSNGKVTLQPNLKILAISKENYQITLLNSTNDTLPLSTFLNRIIKGTQSGGHHVFHYEPSPDDIIKKQGYCSYAIITASVEINTCYCYIPIAPSFYWSPSNNEWISLKMGRLSKAGYHVIY